MQTIANLKALHAIVGEPSELTAKKFYSHLSEQATDFIARSPFLVMATVDENGMPTASPKGDYPGFVTRPINTRSICPSAKATAS